MFFHGNHQTRSNLVSKLQREFNDLATKQFFHSIKGCAWIERTMSEGKGK